MIKVLKNETNEFPKFNEPQLASIRAALSRKLTMIQGPPGRYEDELNKNLKNTQR